MEKIYRDGYYWSGFAWNDCKFSSAFFSSNLLIAGIIAALTVLMIVYKFVFYVEIVKHQLKLLQVLMKETFKYAPVGIIYKNNWRTIAVKPAVNNWLRKLQAVRKIYNMICVHGELINHSSGLTILIVLVDVIVLLTASGYQIFVIIVGGLPMDAIPGCYKIKLALGWVLKYSIIIATGTHTSSSLQFGLRK